MSQDFSGQVVFITGASSGIGLALAAAFRESGARVAGTSRDAGRLPGWLELGLEMDVTDAESVTAAAAATEAVLGRVDILVNNAGVGLFMSWEETSLVEYHRLMDVNFYGTVRVTQALLPGMLERGSGSLVNIASVASERGYAKHTAYCASKHAMLGWSKGMRKDLKGSGVRVVDICPPAIDTPFFTNAGFLDYREQHPGLSLMSPEEVAAQTLAAVARGERGRILGARAKALWLLDTLAPSAIDLLQRLKG
jgi:short-subunit dehydrogenase